MVWRELPGSGSSRAPASIASQTDAADYDHLSPWYGRRMFGRGTGKPRSTKDLRREVGPRARLQVASSSPNLPAENSSLKKVKQYRSRDQKPSAQPSAASGIRTATVEQLIDAMVVRATGKPDSEIAQIVYEITERLNELKRKGAKRENRRPSAGRPGQLFGRCGERRVDSVESGLNDRVRFGPRVEAGTLFGLRCRCRASPAQVLCDVGRHLERSYGHERGRIVALVRSSSQPSMNVRSI